MHAEHEIRAQLAIDLGVEWRGDHAIAVPLPGGSKPEVDAVSVDGVTLVEIYAHQGPLKGGQVHKVARDAFKLATIARAMPHANLHIAFASDEARRSASGGWLGEALETWGISTILVSVSEKTRSELEAAQKRQRMVIAAGEDELSSDAVPVLKD